MSSLTTACIFGCLTAKANIEIAFVRRLLHCYLLRMFSKRYKVFSTICNHGIHFWTKGFSGENLLLKFTESKRCFEIFNSTELGEVSISFSWVGYYLWRLQNHFSQKCEFVLWNHIVISCTKCSTVMTLRQLNAERYQNEMLTPTSQRWVTRRLFLTRSYDCTAET